MFPFLAARVSRTLLTAGVVTLGLVAGAVHAAGMMHTSKPFTGVKVNGGTVAHDVKNGRDTLTLSADFTSPETPAPHWQVVDTRGNSYLLERLMVKGDKGDVLTRTITLPDYIGDIARVQIWCAFAEVLLGETTFDAPISLGGPDMTHTSSRFQGVAANAGSVSHQHRGGASVLTLSDDFKVPDAPAPHWRVVDSRGNSYLLQRLVVTGDAFNKSITVPAYVPDVATVQIWCAYAQVLLGEASFESPVR
jgi:hypothetical protein